MHLALVVNLDPNGIAGLAVWRPNRSECNILLADRRPSCRGHEADTPLALVGGIDVRVVGSADARVPKPMMGNGSQQDEKKTFAKGVDKTNLA